MSEKRSKSVIRIELTPEQQEQVRRATARAGAALELMGEELEERVAPKNGRPATEGV